MSAPDPLLADQLAAASGRRTDRRLVASNALRRSLTFALFVVALAGLYTLYKALGQALDDSQLDWWFIGDYLPRSDDRNMPPILDILREFGESRRAGGKTIGRSTLDGAVFTLREAAVGFAIGAFVGIVIAIALVRAPIVERAVLPWVIVSQTIPLIAIAPIIVIWGRSNFDFLPWEWQDWMSVSLIAVYLTFFPVAVNGIRGLKSADSAAHELMDSYAASWGQTLWRLRLPASLPYLFPALKIAGTASVVGAIVGEISGGVRGGLGRLILDYAGTYTTGPERLYVSVIGAAVLGLVVVGIITVAERIVLGRRGQVAR
ncbi:MAG: ABC transporter permease subunit [Acidimicrobiales bacterium]